MDLSNAPLFPDSSLEIVLSFPEPFGNVAVSSDGRVFFTVHPESGPRGPVLYEVVEGRAEPFPDENTSRTGFVTALGLCIDEQNRLWVIDHGNHGFQGARLKAYNLSTGALVHEHVFDSDGLSIDQQGNVYITDVEHGGVARMAPDGTLTTLIRSDRVRWADGISYGENDKGHGFYYFTDSAIPDQMLQSKAHIEKSAPYFLYRFIALAQI